jgi:hypothetical protein
MLDSGAQFTKDGARLQPIRLGKVALESPVVLAPMSGVAAEFRRAVNGADEAAAVRGLIRGFWGPMA